MRLFLSTLLAFLLSFFGLFAEKVQAQKKTLDKDMPGKIKTLQAERDKLLKRLAQVDAELADLTRPEWTLDLAKMKVPNAPVVGSILGENFKPEKVKLSPFGTLELEQGRSRLIIFLPIKAGQAIEGKSFEFGPDDKQIGKRPSIHVLILTEKLSRPKMQAFSSDYSLRLEFGKQQNDAVVGRIYLCLNDGGRSVIAGTFTLDLK